MGFSTKRPQAAKTIKKAKKKTARESMATNEKSLQRVRDRGGYDPNVPNISPFLHKYRKQTTQITK